jgi:hypothetical protein
MTGEKEPAKREYLELVTGTVHPYKNFIYCFVRRFVAINVLQRKMA